MFAPAAIAGGGGGGGGSPGGGNIIGPIVGALALGRGAVATPRCGHGHGIAFPRSLGIGCCCVGGGGGVGGGPGGKSKSASGAAGANHQTSQNAVIYDRTDLVSNQNNNVAPHLNAQREFNQSNNDYDFGPNSLTNNNNLDNYEPQSVLNDFSKF